MSLRQSPQPSSPARAARSANAQASTGPRSEAGKAVSSFNALKHGLYAARPYEIRTMQALGEDPAEFAELQQSLLDGAAPNDPLEARLLDELARLLWRRRRLERARSALERQEILRLENSAERRRPELARLEFAPDNWQVLDLDLRQQSGTIANLAQLRCFLGMLRDQVAKGHFHARQAWMFGYLAEDRRNWQNRLMTNLLHKFAPEYGTEPTGTGEDQRRVLALIDEEITRTEADLALERRLAGPWSETVDAAALAIVSPAMKQLIAEAATLDRAIDRKARLLLELRKERRRAQAAAGGRPGRMPKASPVCRSLPSLGTGPANGDGNAGEARRTRTLARPGAQPANGDGSPAENPQNGGNEAGMLLKTKDGASYATSAIPNSDDNKEDSPVKPESSTKQSELAAGVGPTSPGNQSPAAEGKSPDEAEESSGSPLADIMSVPTAGTHLLPSL